MQKHEPAPAVSDAGSARTPYVLSCKQTPPGILNSTMNSFTQAVKPRALPPQGTALPHAWRRKHPSSVDFTDHPLVEVKDRTFQLPKRKFCTLLSSRLSVK